MRISDWSSDVCSSDLLALQILGRGDQLLERAGEAVELPNNQRVACAQHVFQNARQFGPVIARARRLFGEHPLAAGPPQRIELELGVLVAGADPGIADPQERKSVV